MTDPESESMALPVDYGRPTTIIPWGTVRTSLAEAAHYWIATSSVSAVPHVVPIDGIWANEALYFGGSAKSAWQRNLASNPMASLHLENAESVVIVEGRCEYVLPSSGEVAALVQASTVKYGYSPGPAAYSSGLWRLTPMRAFAWTRFPLDATRFRFGELS